MSIRLLDAFIQVKQIPSNHYHSLYYSCRFACIAQQMKTQRLMNPSAKVQIIVAMEMHWWEGQRCPRQRTREKGSRERERCYHYRAEEVIFLGRKQCTAACTVCVCVCARASELVAITPRWGLVAKRKSVFLQWGGWWFQFPSLPDWKCPSTCLLCEYNKVLYDLCVNG